MPTDMMVACTSVDRAHQYKGSMYSVECAHWYEGSVHSVDHAHWYDGSVYSVEHAHWYGGSMYRVERAHWHPQSAVMGEAELLCEMLSFYANGGVAAPSSSPALTIVSLPHFASYHQELMQ